MISQEKIQWAKEQLSKHDLHNWIIKWDKAEPMPLLLFGICKHDQCTIILNYKTFIKIKLERCNFRDTVLHEIAHALMGIGFSHRREWQQLARKIGVSENNIKPYLEV